VSGLQFIVATLNAVAWPAVVVIAVILLRPELRRELPWMFRRVKSVEVAGAKMTFDSLADFQRIEEISEAAVKNVAPEDERAIARSEETEFGLLENMAVSAPRDAILRAWNLLEYQLDTASDRIAPDQPHGWPGVARTLEAWDEWAVLNPVVRELFRLRDYTARTPEPPLASDATRYVAVVQDLVTTVRAASFKPTSDDPSGGGG
jgi:hypothetical protein